jgi:methylglutamate dehydrogenase subunit B
MLITCPYCGQRDAGEFTYQGDGNRARPDPTSTDLAAWNAYVFDRVNIAGEHNEIWQHSGGCRSHLAIVRNTLTHKVSSLRMVRDRKPAVSVRKELATTQIALEEQARAAAKSAAKPKARAATRATATSKKAAGKPSTPVQTRAKPRGTK